MRETRESVAPDHTSHKKPRHKNQTRALDQRVDAAIGRPLDRAVPLGTGVVAFNSGFVKALLCDTNPHIIGFYDGVRAGVISPPTVRAYLEREGDALRRADRDGRAHFEFIRDRFNRDHGPHDFLFLSRSGFNGMMRFNRKGKWNVPFCKKPMRFNKSYITKIVNQFGDVAGAMRPSWEFGTAPFEVTIGKAGANDLVYCDPPYWGRHADYYGTWNEEDERRLFVALSSTKASFILSTWRHNEHRKNSMMEHYWRRFNIVTRDHFYHSGAKLHNRRPIVEALVFNFDSDGAGNVKKVFTTRLTPACWHPLRRRHRPGLPRRLTTQRFALRANFARFAAARWRFCRRRTHSGTLPCLILRIGGGWCQLAQPASTF